jgi:hypothetical protein
MCVFYPVGDLFGPFSSWWNPDSAETPGAAGLS